MPQATGLVAELKAFYGDTNVQAELIPGEKGIFDVEVDGRKVFSKHETGRFPAYREIIDQLEMAKVAS